MCKKNSCWVDQHCTNDDVWNVQWVKTSRAILSNRQSLSLSLVECFLSVGDAWTSENKKKRTCAEKNKIFSQQSEFTIVAVEICDRQTDTILRKEMPNASQPRRAYQPTYTKTEQSVSLHTSGVITRHDHQMPIDHILLLFRVDNPCILMQTIASEVHYPAHVHKHQPNKSKRISMRCEEYRLLLPRPVAWAPKHRCYWRWLSPYVSLLL